MKDKIRQFKSGTEFLTKKYLFKYIKNVNPIWNSSAQKLEKALINHGIVLPQKLYYEYKFPGGLSNRDFHDQDILTGFCNIYRRYLDNPISGVHKQQSLKNFLFNEMYYNKKTDLSVFFGFCICLAISDVEKLKSLFIEAQEQLYELADLIKEMNPELQNIKNHRSIDFIAGAEYGFSPQEIQFFLNLQERRKARDFDFQYEKDGKDEKLKHTKENARKINHFMGGNYVTYFLSPETSDKIVDAINEYLIINQNQHSNVY